MVLLFALPSAFVVVAGAEEPNHEVWMIEQSDTVSDGGGTIYIFAGDALAGRDASSAVPEVIDLGAASRSLCLASTGTAPRRAHMIEFNEGGSHAIVSFVATGHVLFIDAAARTPVGCVDVGAQAHGATPSRDGSYVVVSNQNGKLLQRIVTDYDSNTFTLDGAATVDLASCTTPSGAACQDAALRPDNAPICAVIDSSSRFTFVTLRGGGLFVVGSTSTPMAIVAEYDRATIHPNGCGGIEASGRMYINSGGGTTADPLESDLYAFSLAAFSAVPAPPNTPAPTLVFSHDDRGFVDSHGIALTKGGRYLWAGDRGANRIIVVDTWSDVVVGEISLVGSLSDDPAPDLMALALSGNRVYVSFRGPNPLTGNNPAVGNAVGSTPGLAVLRVEAGGARGTLQALVPITKVVDGVERADPHGIAVRGL
ncbi:MAG: YncE family protein [Methanobacteriota archaeon]